MKECRIAVHRQVTNTNAFNALKFRPPPPTLSGARLNMAGPGAEDDTGPAIKPDRVYPKVFVFLE